MKQFRFLILEDNLNDYKLLEYELRHNRISFISKRVDDEFSFRKELKEFNPDLILSDYRLPQFDGMKALNITKEFNPFIPFIIITGSLNEEIAVDCMKAGADDYVIKEHLGKVVPSIINIINKKETLEEKYKAEKEIVRWKERYEIVASTSGQVIYDYDVVTGNIVWSGSIDDVFGYSNDELKLMRDLNAIIHTDDRRSWNNQLKAAQKEVGKFNAEYRLLHKNGHFVYVHGNGVFIPDAEGKAKGMIGMMQDITERELVKQELILAKEKAEKSDKLKSEFLAQISHEIRTPLNAILSFSSLLKEELHDKVDENLRMSFKMIDNGGNRLIRTIDLILNMSQLQTGNFEMNPVKLDLEKDILETVMIDFIFAAKEKKLKLNFNNRNAVKNIYADPFVVSQIFVNLIDNAIKYTPDGKIDVNLFENKSNEVCVEVKDTGIGISAEYLPHLFDPFSQEETGYTRRFDGNGLGLALVKKYIDISNAKIIVKSKKGEGSSFTVIFKPHMLRKNETVKLNKEVIEYFRGRK